MATKTTPLPSQRDLDRQFVQQSREVTEALLLPPDDRSNVYGIDQLTERAHQIICRLREGTGNYRAATPTAAPTSSASVASGDAAYAEALEALDEIERAVRPALERSRRLLAQLAKDVAAAEAAAAEAAAEDARAAQFEAAVQDEVAAAEQRRLQEIADQARERVLAKTGAQ
jgi:hypothetical protein